MIKTPWAPAPRPVAGPGGVFRTRGAQKGGGEPVGKMRPGKDFWRTVVALPPFIGRRFRCGSPGLRALGDYGVSGRTGGHNRGAILGAEGGGKDFPRKSAVHFGSRARTGPRGGRGFAAGIFPLLCPSWGCRVPVRIGDSLGVARWGKGRGRRPSEAAIITRTTSKRHRRRAAGERFFRRRFHVGPQEPTGFRAWGVTGCGLPRRPGGPVRLHDTGSPRRTDQQNRGELGGGHHRAPSPYMRSSGGGPLPSAGGDVVAPPSCGGTRAELL